MSATVLNNDLDWSSSMTDKMILYQPLPRRPFGLIHGNELSEGICYHEPSLEPDSENCPMGEWYCQNTWCVVRQVRIDCKLFGEELPRMRCPACRALLKFHHWLRHETLVPYKGEITQGPRQAILTLTPYYRPRDFTL